MPIRLRIALATAVLLSIALFILGSGIYVTTERNLKNDLDKRLMSVYESYRRNPGDWQRSEAGTILYTNPNPFASAGAYVQILDAQGGRPVRSQNLGNQTIPVSEEVLRRNVNYERVYYNVGEGDSELRVISGRVSDPQSGNLIAFVQVAEPLYQVNETLAGLKRTLILGSVFTMLILAIGAWIVGDTAMRPIMRMSQTVRTIGRTSDLSRRVTPPRTNDEVQALAETFNDMLERLEETFNAQRRFVADASHELRTPLTALRANSDIMLRQIESGMVDRQDLLEGLTDIRDEVDRMSRLVQNLLTLARADVGWRPEMEPVDLVAVARDAARIALPLARGQQFEIFTEPTLDAGESPIVVLGNADQLLQLILILLDNAFRYTPPDSRVTLRIEWQAGEAAIVVSDDGPGISEMHHQHIFKRFYRADDARTSAAGGAGLGLSIAHWIVEVHDGTIDLDSAPGQGTTFTIRLPLLPEGERRRSRRSRERETATAD